MQGILSKSIFGSRGIAKHPRLEKGTVTASMSSDMRMMDAGAPPWAVPTCRIRSARTGGHILTNFPFIGKLEAGNNPESELKEETCVYAHGLALYLDSPLVLERSAELYQGRISLDRSLERDTQPNSKHASPIDFGDRNSTIDEGCSSHTTTSGLSASSASDKTILSTSASPVEAVSDWMGPSGILSLKSNNWREWSAR